MKNKLIRTLTLVFCGVIFVTATACGGKNSAKEDPTMSHLYVFNYDGGIGTDWLDGAKERFEKAYANYSFAEGKTGVDVHITKGKEKISNLSNSSYNILFEDASPVNDYINQGLLLPITDIVNAPLSEVLENASETKTIADKLNARQKAAYTAKGGDYYYLPHYEAYYGLTYDRKVFRDFQLFIKQGGGWTNGTGSDAALLSVGSDGIKGTYDDGLPSSYEEFYALMDRMALVGVVPFIWTGAYTTYLNVIIAGIWASYAGADQFMLNVNFDSEATGTTVYNESVTDVSGEDPIIRNDVITAESGYLTSWQAGKFYAYKLLNKILSNSKYYSDKITGTLTHLEAQQEYIYSDLENQPIGMLIDGSYWHNEAKSAFKRSQNEYPEAGDREFCWMPLPVQANGQVTEGNGRKNTMVSPLLSYSYINGNIKNDEEKVKVAKEFMKFLYTDKELQNFTLSTNCAKGVEYNLTSEQLSHLNHFAKSLYEMRQSCEVVEPVSDSKIYLAASLKFYFAGGSDIFLLKSASGTEYLTLYDAVNAGVNWKEAFLYGRKTQSYWDSTYSRYFN